MKEFVLGLNLYALMIDGLIIFIVLYNIIKSAKQGIIGSLVSFLLLILSYILVWPVSKMVSQNIYELYFKNFFSEMIQKKLMEKGLINVDSFKNFISEILNYQRSNYVDFGINWGNIDDVSCLSEVSAIISDKVIYPVINILISIVILILISLIFSVLIKLLRKFFGFFSYVPVLGKLNRFLGGIFGFLKSIVIVSFLALVINNVILISDDQLEFLNFEIKEKTYLLKQCDRIIDSYKQIDILDFVNKINLGLK